MYFASQVEYEAHYAPAARAAREAKIRAEADAALTRAFKLYNDDDKGAAATCLSNAGFDHDAIASWFAIWR